MKSFSIEVLSQEPLLIYGHPSYWGIITLGGFTEKFVMPLDSWTLQNYQQQWQEGRQRIKTHHVSCVVATVQELATRPFIVIWAFYKEGETVIIRNQFLNAVVAKESNYSLPLADFTLQTCYQFIDHPRKEVDEEGNKIIEWQVHLSDI